MLLAAAFAILWFAPSDHFVYLPDKARPVDPLIRVPGESAARSEGGIYMVDVSIRRASLLERFFPRVDPGSTLVPAHQFLQPGQSERQQREESLKEMSASQAIAKAVAPTLPAPTTVTFRLTFAAPFCSSPTDRASNAPRP